MHIYRSASRYAESRLATRANGGTACSDGSRLAENFVGLAVNLSLFGGR
jgi:hypothetical protein